jgi:hypothetical protein
MKAFLRNQTTDYPVISRTCAAKSLPASWRILNFKKKKFFHFSKKIHPAGASMVRNTAATCGSLRVVSPLEHVGFDFRLRLSLQAVPVPPSIFDSFWLPAFKRGSSQPGSAIPIFQDRPGVQQDCSP